MILWKIITGSHLINMFKVKMIGHHGAQRLVVQLFSSMKGNFKIIDVLCVGNIIVLRARLNIIID